MHAYTHTLTHAYTHIHAHKHTHTYTHTHTHIYISIYILRLLNPGINDVIRVQWTLGEYATTSKEYTEDLDKGDVQI